MPSHRQGGSEGPGWPDLLRAPKTILWFSVNKCRNRSQKSSETQYENLLFIGFLCPIGKQAQGLKLLTLKVPRSDLVSLSHKSKLFCQFCEEYLSVVHYLVTCSHKSHLSDAPFIREERKVQVRTRDLQMDRPRIMIDSVMAGPINCGFYLLLINFRQLTYI